MSTVHLSPRQVRVLDLLSQGLTATQVAEKLGSTRIAVNCSAQQAYRKLGATTAAHAVRIGFELGLISASGGLPSELAMVYRALAAANAELSRRPAQPAPVAMDHQFGVHLLSYREVA